MENIKLTKGMMGYKEVPEGEEFSHVRIDKEQYEAYEKAVLEAKTYLQYAGHYKAQYEKQVRENNALNEKNSKLWDDYLNRGTEIDNLHEQISNLQEQVAIHENRNINLLRVAKERANADRGIQPKKQRSGYLLQNMGQTSQRIFYGAFRMKYITKPCWRVQFQMPYGMDFNFRMVTDSFKEDFMNGFHEGLGLKSWFAASTWEQYTADQINKKWQETENFFFGETFKFNADKGYWEVVFYTRFSIPFLPDIMPNKKTRE